MQATISLLPVSLSLVHVPRSRLSQLSHPIVKQIVQRHPTFLNITYNELELSIFADESLLQDFEPIARKDRHRQRSRSNSSASSKGSSRSRGIDPVEVSYERWCVLQVDSHSNQLDGAGARVSEVSAPLAAAGISILYQSSYMSDFILVKRSRLQEAMGLLGKAGFDIYSADGDSALLSAPHGVDTIYVNGSRKPEKESRDSSTPDPDAEDVLFNSKPLSSLSQSLQLTSISYRSKSYSPDAGEVRTLPSDLACIGLSSEHGPDNWALKIIKLVAFPELIPCSTIQPEVSAFPPSSRHTHKAQTATSGVEAFSRNPSPVTSDESGSDDDGYYSYTPQTKAGSTLHKRRSKSRRAPTSNSSSHEDEAIGSAPPSLPFFSYTQTVEGSSLTADVHVLSTLFPPSERHLINSSGELDDADNALRSDTAEDDDSISNALRCLQIDLRNFGLDKYGLVNRFSQVLNENGINHMYSSTFKTANLLVDKAQARRARDLLRHC